MDLLIEGYRWLVGLVLLLVVYRVLKTAFQRPFVDPLDQPDHMIRIKWRVK